MALLRWKAVEDPDKWYQAIAEWGPYEIVCGGSSMYYSFQIRRNSQAVVYGFLDYKTLSGCKRAAQRFVRGMTSGRRG